jgi:predicted MFS family arabinose efflux permease
VRDSTKDVPVHLLALSVGVIVANIYYVQPLLAVMARTFFVSVSMIGLVAMLTQVGTAIGMLIFVPLGDSRDRRALLTLLLSGACLALCGVATARNLIWISIASFAVGAFGAAVHVIVPFAAQLAPENSRGRVLGTVFSGLLIGILLARTFSGVIASYFGWRSVYFIAALGIRFLGPLLCDLWSIWFATILNCGNPPSWARRCCAYSVRFGPHWCSCCRLRRIITDRR